MDSRRPECGRDIRIDVYTIAVNRTALQDALKTTCEAIALALAVGGLLAWALAACIAAGG